MRPILRNVTISNVEPRLDDTGAIIHAQDGEYADGTTCVVSVWTMLLSAVGTVTVRALRRHRDRACTSLTYAQ